VIRTKKKRTEKVDQGKSSQIKVNQGKKVERLLPTSSSDTIGHQRTPSDTIGQHWSPSVSFDPCLSEPFRVFPRLIKFLKGPLWLAFQPLIRAVPEGYGNLR